MGNDHLRKLTSPSARYLWLAFVDKVTIENI